MYNRLTMRESYLLKKENIISIHDKEKEKEKIWYTIISHIVKVTNTYDGKLYHDGKEVTK